MHTTSGGSRRSVRANVRHPIFRAGQSRMDTRSVGKRSRSVAAREQNPSGGQNALEGELKGHRYRGVLMNRIWPSSRSAPSMAV